MEQFSASLSTDSLQAQVTSAVRKAIISGQLKPGQKLSEEAISQQFGVSRTPVREALKQLEREGLVKIVPRVGTSVTQPSETEVLELFDVKEILEGLAAGLMAKRGSSPELDALVAIFERQEEAFRNGDIDKFVSLNGEFHNCIIRGSSNSKLRFHFDLLINQLPYQRFVYLSLHQPNRTEASVEEHRQVVNAIASGDPERAEMCMRQHVRNSAIQLHKGIMQQLISTDTTEQGAS